MIDYIVEPHLFFSVNLFHELAAQTFAFISSADRVYAWAVEVAEEGWGRCKESICLLSRKELQVRGLTNFM